MMFPLVFDRLSSIASSINSEYEPMPSSDQKPAGKYVLCVLYFFVNVFYVYHVCTNIIQLYITNYKNQLRIKFEAYPKT